MENFQDTIATALHIRQLKQLREDHVPCNGSLLRPFVKGYAQRTSIQVGPIELLDGICRIVLPQETNDGKSMFYIHSINSTTLFKVRL
mmetsp:Transcript_52820/g.152289  ORF Transcript_52820/g.152289 Transcript_52820/m.152289 type:complete len:88 (-) Transcript_52820:108-371(-)